MSAMTDEEIIALVYQHGQSSGCFPIMDFARTLLATEREGCAKMCDEQAKGFWKLGDAKYAAEECAKAIRERGQS